MLLGLGISSISDSWFGFAQNEKTVEDYQERVNRGELPVFRGHILSPEELLIRRHILDLMCHFETVVNDKTFLEEVKVRLREMEADGLVVFDGNKLQVTDVGIPFVRNACMAFDKDLQGGGERERMVSKTV